MGEVLTIFEAAEAVRISYRHLRNLIRDGRGPSVVRLGRRLVVRREAIADWLKQQEERAAQEVA